MSTSLTKRVEYIDIFRGFGIIFMIMGHVYFGYYFDKWIHAFHMPMFFIVSGFFSHTAENFKDLRKKILKNVKKLMVPYFLWGIIHSVLYLILYYENENFSSILNLVWFNTDSLPIAGALWFLTALFFADLIYGFIAVIFVKKKTWFYISILIIASLGTVLNLFWQLRLPWSLDAAFVGSGFLLIGYFLRKLSEKLEWILNLPFSLSLLLGIVFSVLVFINGYINMRTAQYAIIPLFWINAVGCTICGMNLCKCIEKKIIKYKIY